jgi:chemotaxis protein MotB
MADENAIVIKRIKKGGHGGHHGGAWKVAYADFVTAMMAFFLLMWLINTTTPEQKRGIADYFAPQSISQTLSGAGGVLGGKVMGQDSARAGGATSVLQKNSPPSPKNKSQTPESAQAQGGQTASLDIGDANSQSNAEGHAMSSAQDGEFAHAAEAIHQAMQQSPDIAELSRQVIVEQTPEGLRIQLVDQDGRPMFQSGTAVPMPYTRVLLIQIAKIIDQLPNRVSIAGHTQSGDTGNGISDWELSAARADAARKLLAQGGLDGDRIYEISGKAGSEPLLPEDPKASANRRISIVLLREAPPAPPGSRP